MVRSVTTSKGMAHTTQHVNKQTHTFFAPSVISCRMYSGPAKSTPVCVNGGTSSTLSVGSGGGGGSWKAGPSYLLQTIHCHKVRLTTLLPLTIQNRDRSSVKVAFVPQCITFS